MHISKQKKMCKKCGKEFQVSNYKKHFDACDPTKNNIHIEENWLNLETGKYKCFICEKEYSKKGIGSHIWRSHDKKGQLHSLEKRPAKEWHVSWNRGLTKETDVRVKKNGLSVSKSIQKNGSYWTGRHHSEETKRKISQKLSINNKGGRSKWYDVAGQTVQGTWERNIALKFEELGIKWVKLKINKDTLEYVMNGKKRCYTPDFYLPDYDILLEIKGRWWGEDRKKMDIVLNTHPNKKIVIIEKEDYEKILQGELVW